MKNRKRAYEDDSVLALLYDEYKRKYPETLESIQREIESLYEELYGTHLLNVEEITAVFIGLGEDRCRYAHENGVRVGVQLALDLELDSIRIAFAFILIMFQDTCFKISDLQ